MDIYINTFSIRYAKFTNKKWRKAIANKGRPDQLLFKECLL